MRALSWFVFFAAIVVVIYALKLIRGRLERRRKASEERMASLLAQVAPASVRNPPLQERQRRIEPQERLLADAAGKAAEAAEPALAIQLYARLLARYPDSTLAAQARSGVEEQKKRLAKP
jgi:hypothetical protein